MKSKNDKVLIESEEQLRLVFENMYETIVVVQDEMVVYCNSQILELSGYSRAEIQSMIFSELIHPDDKEKVMLEYQIRLSGEQPRNRYSLRIIMKCGLEKFVQVSSTLINWDGRPASLAMLTDITDLKKKEGELLQAQKIAHLGFYDWDFKKDQLYASEELKSIIGKGFEGEYATSEYISNIVHPDDLDFVWKNLELAIKGEKKYDLEHRILRPDGTVIWIASQAEIFHDTDGKPERLMGTGIDITEQKKVQEKLKKSEELFRQLMEQSPLAMEILSTDGKIKLVNNAWRKLWQVTEEVADVTIEKYNMLTDPQIEKLGILDQVQEAFKGKHIILPPIKYETSDTIDDFDLDILQELRSPWIQCHLNSVKDENGKIVNIVNTYVDVTDLKEAGEILGKSKERYRHLMESTPLSIAIFTKDGKLNKVNTAWKNLWGVSEEETVQLMKNYNIFTDKQMEDYGHAPLVARAFKGEDIILPLMKYEGDRATKEMVLEDIKAQSRWIQSHLFSAKKANGEIDYVVNINMDLTELKEAEKEAERQRDILARIDRTSIMGQLTGSIAHELNQPLTGILGNAQAVEMMLRNDTYKSTELLEIINDIVSDTKRAGDVIRNLRELYREKKSEFKTFNISSIIDETLLLLHSEFVKNNVEVKNIPAANEAAINGNKIQVQQVLVNLLMNAIEAMNCIDTGKCHIKITTETNSKFVKVDIDDNGLGIDEDKIDQIFQPLVTWKSGGTGMGLAISHSIIEFHGGTMHAKNLPEGGARVGFKLPIVNENKIK